MVDTMREAGGIGLAANQVGELWRIIVLQMPDEEESRIYFYPEIIKTSGSREVEEGCLSLHLNGILYTDHLAEHQQLYSVTQEDEEFDERSVGTAESPASIQID